MPEALGDAVRERRAAGGSARRAVLRLPLVLFFVLAASSLWYLDSRLVSDYRSGALAQAVRMDALLESGVGERVTFLRAMRSLLASAESRGEQRARFRSLAEELVAGAPDVVAIYQLDAAGSVEARYPAPAPDDDLLADNHLLLAPLADALTRAQRTLETGITGLVPVRSDTLGVVIYEPVVARGRAVGYVAGAIAYPELLRRALAEGSPGDFGYRVLDRNGAVLGVSPDYPTRLASTITREVTLPGERGWTLEVAITPLQPVLARVTLWTVGILLLGLASLLVFREDARAERFAMHSFNLELLSRNLLDANLKLEERAQQVTEANRAKSRFLANVSHELRTPLNAILGYNSLALGGVYGEIPQEMRTVHDRIGAAANHLLTLVDDVLDLSKIEVGRMEVDGKPVDLERMLEEVVSVVEPVADAKGVRVDLVVARELPRIISDPIHLKQILMNLAANAIKFTEHGSVTIVAKRDGSEGSPTAGVRIDVADTGIGIPTEDLERIFDEFEQVNAGGRGDSLTRGVGLGLAIARKLARLLGGDIVAESTVGAGSRFTLLLPKYPPALAPLADAVERRGPGGGGEAPAEGSSGTGGTEQGAAAHGLENARAPR